MKNKQTETAKEQWTTPTVTEFDIAERTQLDGGPGSDGFDPQFDSGGGGGGGIS